MTEVDDSDGIGFDIGCTLDSTPEAVRETLESVRLKVGEEGHPVLPDPIWETVVAEVLNNIVEHAYHGRPGGFIAVRLRFDLRGMRAHFTDRGEPMPGGVLPQGRAADLDVASEDLPEGGFGWFLIHALSEDMDYRREDGVNRLSLTVPLSR